jgi:hypothetical protein
MHCQNPLDSTIKCPSFENHDGIDEIQDGWLHSAMSQRSSWKAKYILVTKKPLPTLEKVSGLCRPFLGKAPTGSVHVNIVLG